MVGRVLCIGECMVELRPAENGSLLKSFAGDSFNTAYYLRAFLPKSVAVDYFTGVGRDVISDEMVAFMEASGIGTSFIQHVAGRSVGLYMIHLTKGERSFSYWRSNSAARLLANDRKALSQAIEVSDVVFFSGITLAILNQSAAESLLIEVARAKAAGKEVAFDPNIRPALWQEAATMRHLISEGARAATIVLPSFEDEAVNFGDATVADTISRYQRLGVNRLVVKNGPSNITLRFGDSELSIPAVPAENVIDTTGAGDSFNAAFLSRYIFGSDTAAAANFAASVAAAVIGHRGALLPLHESRLFLENKL